MQTFFKYLQRFAPMLMCALPVQAVADPPKIVQIGYNGPVPGL